MGCRLRGHTELHTTEVIAAAAAARTLKLGKLTWINQVGQSNHISPQKSRELSPTEGKRDAAAGEVRKNQDLTGTQPALAKGGGHMESMKRNRATFSIKDWSHLAASKETGPYNQKESNLGNT